MNKKNRNLSYYNKLGFDNLHSWKEEDISNFLIWDFMEDMNKMNNYNAQSFFTNSFRIAAQKYKKYKVIIDLIDNAYNKFFSLKVVKKKNSARKKILFNVATNFPLIILETKKSYSVEMAVKGKTDRLFAAENFIKYTSYTNLNQFIYNYLIKRDKHYLYKLLNDIERKIKRIKPDYIVLRNDFFPIERAMVLVSKKLRIPTIIIQHGVFQSVSLLIDGKVADYILTWGQYSKDLYVKKCDKKSKNVYVLGHPYLIEKSEVSSKKNKYYIVYYLGQNFERYNKNLLDIKIKTIKEINKICNKLGIKFIYRPHPGDNRKTLESKLPKVSFTPRKEKLTESFEKGDIFISFTSTSLIEAAIYSKICLQLMNFESKVINFEKLGICNKSFQTIEELEDYLTKIANSPNLDKFRIKFNNNYIETRYNPGRRFLEILNDIEENKEK